jgi:hypothetical protein
MTEQEMKQELQGKTAYLIFKGIYSSHSEDGWENEADLIEAFYDEKQARDWY